MASKSTDTLSVYECKHASFGYSPFGEHECHCTNWKSGVYNCMCSNIFQRNACPFFSKKGKVMKLEMTPEQEDGLIEFKNRISEKSDLEKAELELLKQLKRKYERYN